MDQNASWPLKFATRALKFHQQLISSNHSISQYPQKVRNYSTRSNHLNNISTDQTAAPNAIQRMKGWHSDKDISKTKYSKYFTHTTICHVKHGMIENKLTRRN